MKLEIAFENEVCNHQSNFLCAHKWVQLSESDWHTSCKSLRKNFQSNILRQTFDSREKILRCCTDKYKRILCIYAARLCLLYECQVLACRYEYDFLCFLAFLFYSFFSCFLFCKLDNVNVTYQRGYARKKGSTKKNKGLGVFYA